MSENNSQENYESNAKSFSFLDAPREFLQELLDVKKDTDKEETIETVKTEISFKGHNAWILIFSVFVASIGLNVSSTAVVIGAMLISPLMGPIVGVGLSVAINDIETLKRSLLNLGIMIGLSILTAYLYFSISPLTKLTPELEARTYPTILDVLVAIFGGLALIVAKTKRGTMPSVIYGVAIATALMPPLCTAGYGLAVGNFEYFGGAFYLFMINSIFMALSAFLVTKLLGFPLVRYANSKRRKRIAQIASSIAIIVMIPSAILFWNLWKHEVFTSSADNFVAENIIYEDAFVWRHESSFEDKTITVFLGGAIVPEPVRRTWELKLNESSTLNGVKLEVKQGPESNNYSSENIITLSEMVSRNFETLQERDNRIRMLEQQLNSLNVNQIPFNNIVEEIRINYPELKTISFSNTLTSDLNTIDTTPVFKVRWNENMSSRQRVDFNSRLKNWLTQRLNDSRIIVVEDSN